VQQPAAIWAVSVALLLGAIGVTIWLFSRQSEPAASATLDLLPRTVAGWDRAPGSRHYNPETIFSYIDGHAEVYLAYGLRGCDAERYSAPDGEPDLILDIFEMASPADAFGVFTHDTDGETVGIGRDSRYRYGWLSFWQGPYFVSIMAESETRRGAQVTLELGRRIAALLPDEGTEPAIVEALPVADLEARSVRYLHHPQILNTHLPIDPENLLDLDVDTPAALGTYTRGEQRAYLLVVDYPDSRRAKRVEEALLDGLGGRSAEGSWSTRGNTNSGCRRDGSRLAVVLEAPSEEWMASLLLAVFESGRS